MGEGGIDIRRLCISIDAYVEPTLQAGTSHQAGDDMIAVMITKIVNRAD